MSKQVRIITCKRIRGGNEVTMKIPVFTTSNASIEDLKRDFTGNPTNDDLLSLMGVSYLPNLYGYTNRNANIAAWVENFVHVSIKDQQSAIQVGDVLKFNEHCELRFTENIDQGYMFYDNERVSWNYLSIGNGFQDANNVILFGSLEWLHPGTNISAYVAGDIRESGGNVILNNLTAWPRTRNDAEVNWFNGVPITEPDPDPNAEKWGNSAPGGGKGTRSGDSGKIVNPYAPSVDALDAGFMTAFLPTITQLNDLASYLWSNPISFESLEKLISNPFDLIIGLHMLPISIASSGEKAIKPGALVSGITANYTDKQIVTKDFGTLEIAERWGSVLDYAPYTKISIHLPYIGTRTLDTDEVMNKTIGLKYKVDILSGACVAEISVNGSVMYEFAGNMALDIPITAQDHRQLLATLATIGVTAAGAGLAALGGAGAVAGAGAAASEAAGATGITAATVAQVGNAAVGVVMAAKPTIERAGGLGSAAGWCGVQTPYILIESPEQSLPKNYMGFNGYPCNMSFTLSQLTGYTQCETVRFGSAHATDPEMQEVIASLQAGVVLGGTAPTKPSDPESGIGVTLYQNESPALYVYKNITAYGTQHVCNFKQPTDIVNPTITLELSAIDFNYVYIGGSVDRYYYVTEKRSVRRGVWEVTLKCDPLMSFATDILAAQAVVSRQENEWNLYLDDGTFKAYQYTNFYQEPFATSFNSSTYVLIVAGS